MENIISMICSGAVEAVAGNIVNHAYSSIINKHEMQEELEVTLFGLKNKIKELQSVITEARQRQIINPELAEWLSIIINATYLGDYIHRTFKNRNSLSSMIVGEGTSHWSISSFFRVAKRRRIFKTSSCRDEELREPSNVLKMLNMISVTSFLGMLYAQPKIDRPLRTYLYMDHNRMVGRDKEKEELMKFLLEPKVAGEGNVDILPVIGRRGVGKSTLALHCYYDPMVQSHFSRKIYIPSIYYDLSVYEICRIILKQCNSGNITHHDDENTVVVMLKQSLSSERFLLILGNAWHLNFVVWGVLWDCLRCGKEGSKVILISNFSSYHELLEERVNIRMGKPIMLDFFPEDKYWLFFKEHAFGTADPEDYPELAMRGREIAKSLNGSIWGAIILGEVLRDNLTTQFWAKVLGGILGLGYIDPPWSIIETIVHLLPERLKLKKIGIHNESEHFPSNELTSFRELMVLGPNHYKLATEKRKNGELHFVVTKNVFLSRRTVITAICKPFGEDSVICV